VPATVPGDFTVRLGDVLLGQTYREMVEEFGRLGGPAAAARGFLTLLEFVEVEAQGFPEMLEELRLLKGAVMAVAAPVVGRL